MVTSNFNIETIRAINIKFEVEEMHIGTQTQLPVEIQSHSRYALSEEDSSVAKLETTIEVFPTEEHAPFRISVTMEGIFRWNENFDRDSLEVFLKINGNALLYSYARPIITQLTVSAGFPPLVLPLADFTKDIEKE